MALLKDKTVRRSLMSSAIAILGFSLWAGFVPLDEGLVAQGHIVAEIETQSVQHLEGGIVSAVHIREGDNVTKDQRLLTLETSTARAEFQEVASSLASSVAQVETLRALLDGREADYGKVPEIGLTPDETQDLIDLEDLNALLRSGDHKAQMSQITGQITGLRRTIRAKDRELQALKDAEKINAEEVGLSERLVAANVETVDRLRALQRSLVDNRLRQRTVESSLVETRNQISDLESQAEVLKTSYRKALSQDLKETQDRVDALQARLPARADALRRFDVLAPRAGKVINLESSTVGGVVRPGDTIMEIVPSGDRVLGTVRILPNQRAQVFEGLKVRATLTAYRGLRAAPVEGTVAGVSADLKQDNVTGERYYEARVELANASLEAKGLDDVTPGMPVQVFIFSGKSRTTLDYLLAPVRDSLYKAVRAS